jgi:hypothetical protein
MPGRTGKRAKLPSPCKECGKKIVGDFNRNSDGDRHPDCWRRWWDRKSGKHQKETPDQSENPDYEAFFRD